MTDFDAIVIGAGHNGLVCAAYLARAGRSTLLVEARPMVGGTAASETFAGARVNICNCDHLTFRTTGVIEELGLEQHGLRYLDLDPSQINTTWTSTPWQMHHDVEATLDQLARSYPAEVDNYRRYLDAALPAARLVLANAAQPPTMAGIGRRVAQQRGRGAATLLRWSRRSAADIMREYFTDEALRAPAMVIGPVVWGISPEFPGSGLGALTYALRHAATLGRPEGGSGKVTEALRSVFETAGGSLMLNTAVDSILTDRQRVLGVELADGTQITADVVVSACNPHDTFLRWLKHPPSGAERLVARWRKIPHEEGYESKIDAVLSTTPVMKWGSQVDMSSGCTVVIAPSLADIHRGYEMSRSGGVLDRPAFLMNVPTLGDATLAPKGRHVLSLEALYTPYSLPGGWASSTEPARWLDRFYELCSNDVQSTIIDWRAMTPDRYEREFHLPAGHATSFAGGPLAAIRNRNPELTRYETAVPGLYLTGAATFPGAGVWGASGKNAASVVLHRQPDGAKVRRR